MDKLQRLTVGREMERGAQVRVTRNDSLHAFLKMFGVKLESQTEAVDVVIGGRLLVHLHVIDHSHLKHSERICILDVVRQYTPIFRGNEIKWFRSPQLDWTIFTTLQ